MMENVRIAVLSTHDKVCAFLDNGAPEALHYYNDELHSFREGSANTYSFKALAKHGDSHFLAEGNKLAFQHDDRDYYFNIVKVVRDEYAVEVTAYSMVFELLNEEVEAYKAPKAMKFAEYLDVFDFEKVVELGINEAADKTVSHEWTGTSTILARLFSLVNVFGAEVEFVPVLNPDYSLKSLIMNVYKEHDGEHQGIGRNRTDMTLRYGRNVKGITKTSDITSLFTAIRPYGKDNLTIAGVDKRELDAEGNVEYESPKGNINIYARQARDRFPSNLMGKGNDRYIAKIWSYETDNVNVLYGQALAELKKLCVPKVSYEVEGYFDTDIGDTVTITDEEFNPPLYLEARVTEQIQSFTDPKRNKTTFDNFRELKSEVDTSLLDKMNELIKENKIYACTITTDNGIVFKNGEGTTSLTANVRDAGADKTDQFEIRWKKDDVDLAVGKTVVVHARDIAKKAVYRFEALEGAIVRGSYEVTVSNVSDGADGKNGVDGKDGKDGAQGKDGVGVAGVDVQYYKSSSATVLSGGVWQTNAPAWENGKYIWTKTVITYTDGRTGETAAVCMTGSDGGEGADGRGVQSIVEQYYKSASATVLSGGTWSGTYPGWENGKYIWTRSMVTYTDGSSKMTEAVCVTGGKGDSGKDGIDGKGIKSVAKYYLASTAVSGITAGTAGWTTAMQTTTTSKKYLWNYEVVTYTDNTTYVSTPVIIGTHGATGPAGQTGPTGADGQMLYATSGTAAATAAKAATLVSGTIALKAGVTVAVRFTYANTAASPTLNINGTGAKAVYTQGVRYAYWSAGATVIFTYDGSYWRVASEPVYASTATIGNPVGLNIYADGSAVNIRNGTTILAKFANNLIELGKNSASSEINLCNGAGSIEAYNSNMAASGLFVRGEKIRLSAKGAGESGASSVASVEVGSSNVNLDGNIYFNGTLFENKIKWKLLKEVSNTSFGAVTVPSNLGSYTEFLLTAGPFIAGDTAQNNRVLASTAIPVDALRNTKGRPDTNGVHQAYYSSTYWAGINYISDTTIQIKASAAGAIARLWAR